MFTSIFRSFSLNWITVRVSPRDSAKVSDPTPLTIGKVYPKTCGSKTHLTRFCSALLVATDKLYPCFFFGSSSINFCAHYGCYFAVKILFTFQIFSASPSAPSAQKPLRYLTIVILRYNDRI